MQGKSKVSVFDPAAKIGKTFFMIRDEVSHVTMVALSLGQVGRVGER